MDVNKRDEGIIDKFVVTRVDGTDAPGEKHHGCRYWVLDIDHDPYAKPSLQAYADVCKDEYPALHEDLINLLAEL